MLRMVGIRNTFIIDKLCMSTFTERPPQKGYIRVRTDYKYFDCEGRYQVVEVSIAKESPFSTLILTFTLR